MNNCTFFQVIGPLAFESSSLSLSRSLFWKFPSPGTRKIITASNIRGSSFPGILQSVLIRFTFYYPSLIVEIITSNYRTTIIAEWFRMTIHMHPVCTGRPPLVIWVINKRHRNGWTWPRKGFLITLGLDGSEMCVCVRSGSHNSINDN